MRGLLFPVQSKAIVSRVVWRSATKTGGDGVSIGFDGALRKTLWENASRTRSFPLRERVIVRTINCEKLSVSRLNYLNKSDNDDKARAIVSSSLIIARSLVATRDSRNLNIDATQALASAVSDRTKSPIFTFSLKQTLQVSLSIAFVNIAFITEQSNIAVISRC